ncbi:DUF6114 domain-containing protein [Actinacidiphila oryziradicis]|uniref:DUF6114 domain-containing protein n=1 Tax=Actinacidiphila oryziradicis TaxID=2571141 RepID=UPI0023F4C88E|nr:DUF6114 domain-containing protein [Actinacidiphila oryziradicis]MCW2871933.1 hypothetical protein [Actinacidiphila oryziradicis]
MTPPHEEEAGGAFTPPAAHEPAEAGEYEPAAPVAPPTKRERWRAWRGRRPFWGGLLVTLGGGEILLTEKAALPVILHIGMQGLAGYLIPLMLVIVGLLTLFNPAQRLFYAIVGVLLTLGTWITSNLGGFFIGLLLGVIGSCITFGWVPDQEPRRRVLRKSKSRSQSHEEQPVSAES